MAVVEPTKLRSDEFIEIELLNTSHRGCGDTDQVILVEVPVGFVTIVGRARVKGVLYPIL